MVGSLFWLDYFFILIEILWFFFIKIFFGEINQLSCKDTIMSIKVYCTLLINFESLEITLYSLSVFKEF